MICIELQKKKFGQNFFCIWPIKECLIYIYWIIIISDWQIDNEKWVKKIDTEIEFLPYHVHWTCDHRWWWWYDDDKKQKNHNIKWWLNILVVEYICVLYLKLLLNNE